MSVPSLSLDGFGEIAYSRGVEKFGELGIVLGFVNVGVGGTVDYHINAVVLYGFFYGFGVGDVEFGHIGEYVFVYRVGRAIAQRGAELSVGSCYKYVHSA